MNHKQISANLLVYGTAHALVDLVSAGIVFSLLNNQLTDIASFGILVILYNVLAFGLQAIFGYGVDIYKSPRASVLLACIIIWCAAFSFLYFPVLAVVLAGIGNAMFHVGGGSICLNLTPGKASAPGIFVAPGALGLLAGTVLGKNGQFIAWHFVLILAILCVLMFIIPKPQMNYQRTISSESNFNYFELILLLILISVVIRSMIGLVIVFPWKTNMDLLIFLTLAVFSGKALGGILADKFGWLKVAAGSLLISIPFLVFFTNIAWLAIIGMFLFNITMPVTLVAVSNLFPGRPGFAFGLTCLALIIGALPSFSSIKHLIGEPVFIFIFILISLIAVYIALRMYFTTYAQKKAQSKFKLKLNS